jgi:phosphotransferase system  glucose/maltose/N-acetylglucosamine-specific IIC component
MVLKHSWVLAVAVFLFLISLYEGRKIGHRWRYSILPVLYTLSSVALLYLIGIFYEQQVFIILSSLLYYLSLLGASRLGNYEGDQTARGMNTAASSATIFFAYASAYGLYLNFLVPLYLLMLTYLIITLFVSYQHFAIIKKDSARTVWIYSFLLALAMAELIWTMNFWPFGYLTTGVIALILYYVLWDIISSHFLDLFSRQRIITNTVLFSVLIVIILLSSKWIPVI